MEGIDKLEEAEKEEIYLKIKNSLIFIVNHEVTKIKNCTSFPQTQSQLLKSEESK